LNFQDFDDGFYVCDLGDVLSKHRRWLREFPRIKPFYAIKCNPDPTMLKTLLALSTGFDCASKVRDVCFVFSSFFNAVVFC